MANANAAHVARLRLHRKTPLVLSLSKHRSSSFRCRKKERPFDKLRANGKKVMPFALATEIDLRRLLGVGGDRAVRRHRLRAMDDLGDADDVEGEIGRRSGRERRG